MKHNVNFLRNGKASNSVTASTPDAESGSTGATPV